MEIPTLEQVIVWGGYAGLFGIVFAETGLFFGFFLPGDSLLVTAGLFAATGQLNIVWLNLLLWVAAITGDAVGYTIGFKAGKGLYDKPDSRFFKRKYLLQTKDFYEQYGGITITIARFMPFARTFAPVVAGIAQMRYRRFAVYNITGGILWITSMTLIGYFLGRLVPGIAEKIEYVIAVIVFLSVLPLIIKFLKVKYGKKATQPPPSPPPQGGRD
jgi:membrane-associated protein